MKRKLVVLLLAGILVLSTLAGCSNDQSNKNTKEEKKTEKATQEELPGLLITKEPLDLTMHLHFSNGTRVYKDDYEVFGEIAKLTNINVKGTATTEAGDSNEVFNLMIASGDIPDIIHTSKDNVMKYSSKLFLPLDELINEHAPHLKAFLDERPDVIKYMKGADGNMYFIPFIPDGEAAQGWFIRKDWLDKVGMDVPETVDEYLAVLKAFRDQDVNGNGKKDEVGYFDRDNKNGVYDVLNLFGVTKEDYVKDGKVYYDLATEKYKDAMIGLQKMYVDGLIDPEIFTRGKTSRDIMFDDNIGASTNDWFGSTSGYQDKYGDKIENLEWVPMAPPADPSGRQWTQYSRPQVWSFGWGISKDNKHAVETIKYMDFFFTEEGRRLMNFGIEGKTYDMVDGKPIFNESVLNGDQSVLNALLEYGAQLQVGFHQDFEYEKQWMNPIAVKGAEMYIENGYAIELLPAVAYTPEEEKLIATKGKEIETFVAEYSQKWVLGATSVEDTFDEYLNALKKMGIEEVLAAKQAAYDRYLNN